MHGENSDTYLYNKMFSGDQVCQFGAEVQNFRDILCLYHQEINAFLFQICVAGRQTRFYDFRRVENLKT
jgi:hypothetical protein